METGAIARQADGAVLVDIGRHRGSGDVPSAIAKRPIRARDFFPLTVNYQEKTYAAGKIPGGFFKREGRPSGKRDADLSPHRPADSPAVSRRASRTRCRSLPPSCP